MSINVFRLPGGARVPINPARWKDPAEIARIEHRPVWSGMVSRSRRDRIRKTHGICRGWWRYHLYSLLVTLVISISTTHVFNFIEDTQLVGLLFNGSLFCESNHSRRAPFIEDDVFVFIYVECCPIQTGSVQTVSPDLRCSHPYSLSCTHCGRHFD